MEYLKSLMVCSRTASEEDVEKLAQIRWDKFEKKKRPRSIALREEYRKEVKDRKDFLERMKANPLLDQVAWDRVVSFVKEPKDIVNMWGVFELWRKSVKLRITTTLFSEVFPKLVEGGILSTNDVLNCRSVCKTWRDSVDRFMVTQQLWRKWEIGDINVFNVNLPSSRLSVNLYGPWNVNNSVDRIWSLRQWHRVHENVPAGASKAVVRILGDWRNRANGGNGDSYYIATRMKGWAPKHLHIECEGQDEAFNIHWIVYLWLRLWEGSDVETLIVRAPSETRVEEGFFEHALRPFLFPPLESLRTFVVSGFQPPTISAMLKRYGSQLETLVIDKGSHEIMAVIQKHKLKRLKRLDFASVQYYEAVNSAGLSLKTSVLEEIDLRFIQILNLDVSRLILSLNKFGKTLKRLQLTFQTTRQQTLNFDKPVRLVVLEKLKLALRGIPLRNIDFLIPSVRLKVLELTEVINWTRETTSSLEKEKGEHIKFSNYKDRLYESNIWRMFPELRIVRITQIIKNVDEVVAKTVKRVFAYDRFEYNQL